MCAHHVVMDPSYASNTWRLLRGAIREIHRANASGLSFEELYRNAYNMVLHKYGDLLYQGLCEVVDEHLASVAESIHTNENFLAELHKAWSAHKTSMLMIRDILMYMDRVYVPHKGDCEPVYDVGLLFFYKNIVSCPRIREHLCKTLLEEIRKERCGEVIQRGLIKSATQMLVDVGISSLKVYESDFEKAFLEATASFYAVEGREYVVSTSVPAYLSHVETRLREESARVLQYLDSSTKPKLVAVVDRELLSVHLLTLLGSEETGFLVMLRENMTQDLSRMYTLFLRVEGGHKLMMEHLSRYVQDVAMQLIAAHQAAIAEPKKDEDEKAKGQQKETFVEPMLELKEKFNRILRDAFESDPNFQRTVNQAFEAALNSDSHSPEYLSLFLDDKLKRGLRGVTEEQIEAVIEQAVELFRLISEKDAFERYYKQHLARRLLLGKSVSDYAERQVIAALKRECGYQFTSRLEGMFQDIRTSQDTMTAFSSHLATQNTKNEGPEISVHVLTTGFWPVQQMPQCVLPPSVAAVCTLFQDFYLARHNGRKLAWQTSMGNADLRLWCGTVVNVSTYQMVVLLLFNSASSLSLEAIQQATNVEDKELRRHLLSLLRAKLLTKTPIEPKKKVENGDVFQVNLGFKSKLRRVTVALVGASNARASVAERAATDHKINEDRKLAIQAAIVRVMKSRKQLSHPQLVSEVIRLLSGRFQPKPTQIKKQIESLIERDYLERSTTERKMLLYIA